jgi:uncharacterized protein YndB with AHSA1/START domain
MAHQIHKHSVVHDTFVIERIYPQSPEKVFTAFSDPTKKRRWMSGNDEGFEIETFDMDFQVDKFERWQFTFKGGERIKTEVRYQDIVENNRIVIVYTMTFGDKRVSSSQITTELIPENDGTKLIHTEQGVFFDGVDQAAGRKEGTKGLLEALAKELDSSE